MPERCVIFQAFLRLYPMKKAFTTLLLLVVWLSSFAQLKDEDLATLKAYEAEFAILTDSIVYGYNEYNRAKACFEFIPKLVEALKTPNSFHYPFDSLFAVSILQPDDKSFRIFTWQLKMDDQSYRYYGAIQMNKKKLELYPLYDYSDSLYKAADTVLTPESWYGCLYYNLKMVKHKKKKYYMLFGWDGNDLWSMRKMADVLTFQKGEPIFGAPIFELKGVNDKTFTIHRFMLEYKKDANVSLNYSDRYDMIVFDHLVSQFKHTDDLQFTYVPDGSYVGFKFEQGLWKYVDRPFGQQNMELEGAPTPKPVDFDKDVKQYK